MAEPIEVTPRVVVPAAALSLRATRASGPGGQNVNKVASKVELRVDLERIEGLPADARQRLLALCAGRCDAGGRLVVRSQRTRDPASEPRGRPRARAPARGSEPRGAAPAPRDETRRGRPGAPAAREAARGPAQASAPARLRAH